MENSQKEIQQLKEENIKFKGKTRETRNQIRMTGKRRKKYIIFKATRETKGHNPLTATRLKASKEEVHKLEVATLNMRTLRTEDMITELEYAVNKLKWNVIGIAEVRKNGEKIIKRKSGNVLYYKYEKKGYGRVGFKIHTGARKKNVGRPDDPEIAKAFRKICDYIEESNDCQCSVEELLFVSDKKDLENYNEILAYEAASAKQGPPVINERAFAQFVFGNADINLSTIDGHGTFHCMEGIKGGTPTESVEKNVPLWDNTPGLKSIQIEDFNVPRPIYETFWIMTPSDILWLLDLPASSYDAINSVLHFANKKISELKLKRCFVTFDQPLYAKVREIVALSPDLPNITVRLAGFHMLMSFMSAIGHIMNESGLKEVWS
ncbi:hypothetical protein ILUMI_19837 [Ignelater luminosus]|uniref:Uncharacterized protein n=1 Tax=Ignelater luminosus TaxID=2038154 RepID=A0A8K0G574_IGNLU|nr:hypothetical protein ILUMI_19837 [Ignelater luminosus]